MHPRRQSTGHSRHVAIGYTDRTMTSSTSAAELDPTAFLASVGWPAPAQAARITTGWDTHMWRIVTPDGAPHALRIYRPGPGRDVRGMARRETAALRATREGGLPAPAVEAEGEHVGYTFLILSWMPGAPILQVLGRQPWRLWPLGVAFGRMHARFHRVPPPDEVRPPAPTIWTRYHVRDEALAEAVVDRAVSDTFCHFDYHPLNVLADRRGITALLDFVNATVADRRADLGVTQGILRAAPIPPGPLKRVMLIARSWFAAAWRRGYRAEAGELPLMPLFEAWGAAYLLPPIEEAVRDGRGWAEPTDLVAMRRYITARKRAAGLA